MGGGTEGYGIVSRPGPGEVGVRDFDAGAVFGLLEAEPDIFGDFGMGKAAEAAFEGLEFTLEGGNVQQDKV